MFARFLSSEVFGDDSGMCLGVEVEAEAGARYEGQWQDKQYHGQGVLTKADGAQYFGSYVNGHAHGHGVFIAINGNTYEGQWDQDRAHGLGKYNHEDGSFYEGEWKLDEKSGRGVETWRDGARYEGQFLHGLKHGIGSYKSAKGVLYDGQFHHDKMDGVGCYKFEDGRKYDGPWQCGHMHGIGKMIWPDGSSYGGMYERDLRHGEGTFTWPDGRVYSGQWRQGKKDGMGMVTKANGVSLKGEWRNGTRLEGRPDPEIYEKYEKARDRGNASTAMLTEQQDQVESPVPTDSVKLIAIEQLQPELAREEVKLVAIEQLQPELAREDDVQCEKPKVQIKRRSDGYVSVKSPRPDISLEHSHAKKIAWVSLDPRTGDVVAYPLEVTTTIEARQQMGKEFACLGSKFHDATVLFEVSPSGLPKQQTPKGLRDVRRLEVEADVAEVEMGIVGAPGVYRFVCPGDAVTKMQVMKMQVSENFVAMQNVQDLVRSMQATEAKDEGGSGSSWSFGIGNLWR